MGEFVPLYRQVSQRIFRKIQQGVYKYGDKIPSEKELAAYYVVNRMTVRRAVSLLSEQGILKSMQGKGVLLSIPFIRHAFPKTACSSTDLFSGTRVYGRNFCFCRKWRQEKLLGICLTSREIPLYGCWGVVGWQKIWWSH